MKRFALAALFLILLAGGTVAAAVPDATRVPFQLVDRLIVVQADIGGVTGNYLVDTGAQSIVLNAPRFADAEIDTVALNHGVPTGVGGAIQHARGARDLRLAWAGLRLQGLRALVLDLSHLEANLDIPLMGIIGFEVLERFQVHFDYENLELRLVRLDADGNAPAHGAAPGPAAVLDFEMAGHLPVLPVRIAGQELRLGLDSGAAGAMLSVKWQEPLREYYEFQERTELRGADHRVQMGDVVRMQEIQVADLSYAGMTFRFNDLAGHNGRALPMDGLLGYELLARRPTAINFRTRQLLIW